MINYISKPFKWFFKLEAASGLLLLIAAILALIISNSELSNLYFHSYKDRAPKSLRVKYISDSNHMWKFGHPLTTNNSKLQLLMHPFSWTQKGYENTRNFETLITEKNKEMISSISSEIKTFPTELS